MGGGACVEIGSGQTLGEFEVCDADALCVCLAQPPAVADVLCGHGGRDRTCENCTSYDVVSCNSLDCQWISSRCEIIATNVTTYPPQLSFTTKYQMEVWSSTVLPDSLGLACAGASDCVGGDECVDVGRSQKLEQFEVCSSAATCLCQAPWGRVVAGSCTIDADECATSPNYPDYYNPAETCNITVSSSFGGFITAEVFATGYASDYLYVNNRAYHGSSGPVSVKPTTPIFWTSDSFAVSRGWKVCPDKKISSTTSSSVITTTTLIPIGVTKTTASTTSSSRTSSSRTLSSTKTSSTSTTFTATTSSITSSTSTYTTTGTEGCCCLAEMGDPCYSEVIWAKETGIHSFPQWYPGLTESSSFTEFQAALHAGPLISCPDPCPIEGEELMSYARSTAGVLLWMFIFLLFGG